MSRRQRRYRCTTDSSASESHLAPVAPHQGVQSVSEQLRNTIVDALESGSFDAAEKLIGDVPLGSSKTEELLSGAWHWLESHPRKLKKKQREAMKEQLRQLLQDNDEALGVHQGGAARCPFCLKMNLWGEAETCEHYMGAKGADLYMDEEEEEDMGYIDREIETWAPSGDEMWLLFNS